MGNLLATHYERPETVDHYTSGRGLTRREVRAVENYFPEGARVLDLGCGAGRTTEGFVDLGFDVVGVDLSRGMVDAAKRAVPDAAYAVSNAAELGFADDTFDAVLFSHFGLDNVLPMQARQTALREIHRVLRPGGRFAFSTHNLLREFVPFPLSTRSLADRYRFWRVNVTAGLIGERVKWDTTSGGEESDVSDDPLAQYRAFTDPLTQYRELRATGFDVLDMLGKRGFASRFLGTALFVVASAGG